MNLMFNQHYFSQNLIDFQLPHSDCLHEWILKEGSDNTLLCADFTLQLQNAALVKIVKDRCLISVLNRTFITSQLLRSLFLF